MRYTLLASSKRIRPIISFLVYEMLGGKNSESILYPSCAVELVHTYSIIHDDLPAMDDDDYRRGQLSNHKKFGEAVAILTGDSLLTLAFEWIAKTETSPSIIIEIVKEVSSSSGILGMIGGQFYDLKSQGVHNKLDNSDAHHKDKKDQTFSFKEKELKNIHEHKTAALIQCAVTIPALIYGVSEPQILLLKQFGLLIGHAFQIIDDVLDIEGKSSDLGKSTRKDLINKKLTYPSLYGLDASKKKAKEMCEKAKGLIENFTDKSQLESFFSLILYRKN